MHFQQKRLKVRHSKSMEKHGYIFAAILYDLIEKCTIINSLLTFQYHLELVPNVCLPLNLLLVDTVSEYLDSALRTIMRSLAFRLVS